MSIGIRPDISYMSNSINNNTVKMALKKLGKKNAQATIDAINELCQEAKELNDDYFLDIAGHCCAIFDNCLYEYSDDVKISALKLVSIMIVKLKSNLAGYAPLIFPSLLLYMHDNNSNISHEAHEIFNSVFQTPEKRNTLLIRMLPDTCAKIQQIIETIHSPLQVPQLNNLNQIWGNICSATLSLFSFLLTAIKKSKDIDELIDHLSLPSLMQTTEDSFCLPVIPSVRYAVYHIYQISISKNLSLCHSTDEIVNYLRFENDSHSLSELLKLIIILIDKSQIDPELIKSKLLDVSILSNFHNLSEIGFQDFLQKIALNDESFEYKLAKTSIFVSDKLTAKSIFEIFLPKLSEDFLKDIFPLFLEENPKSSFLSDYPLQIFKFISNFNEFLMPILLTAREERFIEYLPYLQAEQCQKWLSSRQGTISYSCFIAIIKMFGDQVIRSVFPSISIIMQRALPEKQKEIEESSPKEEKTINKLEKASSHPQEDHLSKTPMEIMGNQFENTKDEEKSNNDPLFLEFASLFMNSQEASSFLGNASLSGIYYFLTHWTRDYSILKSSFLHERADEILFAIQSLTGIFLKIFPNDSEIQFISKLVAVNALDDNHSISIEGANYHMTKNDINEVFDQVEPDEKFIVKFLLSKQKKEVDPSSSLFKSIIEFLPRIVQQENAIVIGKALADLIISSDINPIQVPVSSIENVNFRYEFWVRVGFEYLNIPDFIFLLEDYLSFRVPWFYALLYAREVDWEIIPEPISSYILQISNDELMDYLIFALDNHKQIALSCLSYIHELTLDQIPLEKLDNFFYSTFPQYISKEKCHDPILRMESFYDIPLAPPSLRNLTPNSFTTKESLDRELRQTIAYLQYYLPILNDFNSVSSLLIFALQSNFVDRFTFFLILRIIALIAPSNGTLDAVSIFDLLLPYTVKFYPFMSVPESELKAAFTIVHKIDDKQFQEIVKKNILLFSDPHSKILTQQIIEIIQYFQIWDFALSSFSSSLDISNIHNWGLLTSAILVLPTKKRIEAISLFSKKIPRILSSTTLNSQEFFLLATVFPKTINSFLISAFSDYEKYSNLPLFMYENIPMTEKVFKDIFRKIVSPKVLRRMKKSLLSLKFDNTKTSWKNSTSTITFSYRSDPYSAEIVLTICFPEDFPLEQPKIKNSFKDPDIYVLCNNEINSTIQGTQSIEAGVIAWHKFVMKMEKDSDPCTICYSFFDENKRAPNIRCSICHNNFHSQCIYKWLSRSVNHTCPYCGFPWHPLQ